MLKNVFSNESTETLFATPSTLCVLPLSGQCQVMTPGVIESGLAGFGQEPINEVWQVEGDRVERGQQNNIFWCRSTNLICASVPLDVDPDESSPVELTVERAYTQLIRFIRNQGYPYPMRLWNYLPKINLGDGDGEMYKRFCTGRLNAFNSLEVLSEEFPAASALGHHDKGGVIYVFAGKTPVLNFQNNKQVNAYEYPRVYGRSSPSFARASAVSLGDHNSLFISGTASIIGHQTVEVNSLHGQLKTTLNNIQHLLRTSNPYNAKLSTMKVYLRHKEQFPEAKRWLDQYCPNVAIVYTLADVCRANLLVEIECFCQ